MKSNDDLTIQVENKKATAVGGIEDTLYVSNGCRH